MSENIVDTSVLIEWIDDGGYWTCPLIGQKWAKFAGLIKKTADGMSKVDGRLYQLEKHHSGEYRILWMGEKNSQPDRAYAQVIAKPKPPSTFLGIPISLLNPIAAALGTALLGVLAQYSSVQAGALNPDEAKEITEKLSEAQGKLAEYVDEEKELHRLFLDEPGTPKLSYVLGLSHAYRIEVIKRLSGDQAQLKSMLTGIEEDYIRDTFAGLNQSAAFSEGKAHGQKRAIKVFSLGEAPVLGGAEILRNLSGG